MLTPPVCPPRPSTEISRAFVEGLCGPDLNRGISMDFNECWWNMQWGTSAYLDRICMRIPRWEGKLPRGVQEFAVLCSCRLCHHRSVSRKQAVRWASSPIYLPWPGTSHDLGCSLRKVVQRFWNLVQSSKGITYVLNLRLNLKIFV